MNKVILIGRLTKDLELKYVGSKNTAMIQFSVAVDGYGANAESDFVPCKAFGKTAETMDKYLGKGRRVAIEGHLNSGKYEKDGKTIYSLDTVVDRFEFVDSVKNENNGSDEREGVVDVTDRFREENGSQASFDGFEAIDDNDIPF